MRSQDDCGTTREHAGKHHKASGHNRGKDWGLWQMTGDRGEGLEIHRQLRIGSSGIRECDTGESGVQVAVLECNGIY